MKINDVYTNPFVPLKHFVLALIDTRGLSCRAPVLVALALMECGLKYEDAVELIRQ